MANNGISCSKFSTQYLAFNKILKLYFKLLFALMLLKGAVRQAATEVLNATFTGIFHRLSL